MGNSLVILLVAVNESLHSPMYFFLSQVSVSEIFFTSNIVPTMLHLVLFEGGTMSIRGCLIQFFLMGISTIAQSFLLAAMSFDRYVAICSPLHYVKIMTFKMQVHIALVCWLFGFLTSLLVYLFLYQLEFCDFNVIDHYFCDMEPVLRLSCSDTSVIKEVVSLLSTPVVITPFLFIIVTYISILHTILKIPTNSGKQKAFSTCSSHLAVVCVYYGTLATLYIFKPKESSGNVNKSLPLLYILVTPLLNPIIYSFRNQGHPEIFSNFKDMDGALMHWNKSIKCLSNESPI
ncbi:olfactory receptor 10R2-like [Pelodytes ibericus]